MAITIQFKEGNVVQTGTAPTPTAIPVTPKPAQKVVGPISTPRAVAPIVAPKVQPKENILQKAFSKEDYATKFKKGDIAGGIANLAGATLTAGQSAYLNLANQLASVIQGKGLQPIQYQMSYEDYEKAVAERGGVKPTSEVIREQSPLLANIYKVALEVGTDPLELTPLGFLNDIKAAKGATPLTKLPTPTQAPRMTAQPTSVPSGINIPQATQTPPTATVQPSMATPQPSASTSQDVSSFMSKISYKKEPREKPISQRLENLRMDLTDNLAPLERLEKQATGRINSAEQSLYKTARLTRGVPEQASGRIEFQLKPIIKAVESAGLDYKDLGAYALARHAQDVNALGYKSGFTDNEINAILQKYQGNQALEDARLALLKYNDDLIQTLADSGRISQDFLANMRAKFPNYMPLQREIDELEMERSFTPGSPIKSLKGTDLRKTIDPLESIVGNTYKLLASAAQNDVGIQLKNIVDNNPNQTFVRRLGKDDKARNAVTVFENGERVRYEVDENVYKAFEGLNESNSNVLIKMLSYPTSLLRAGATLTPEFAARNPMRDVVQAYVTSGFNPVTDFARGLASYLGKDDMYKSFLENKGAFGNLTSYDRTTNRKILKDIIKTPVSKKFINVIDPRTTVELMRKISDATETATKLGMYKKGIREGLSEAESAYQARDLMDFARKGSTIEQANKVIAFANANIQGKSKLYRAIKEDPIGVTSRMAKGLVIPAITVKALQYALANEEQTKTIEDAPDWLKDTFYLIPVPGTNMVARIPKPFDLAIVANGTERFMDYFLQNDPTAFDGFVENTLKNQSVPIIPTAALPLAEAWANKSFFRQAPIVPMREQNLPKSMQFDVGTSELSKTIAGGIEAIAPEAALASPRITENTIKGYTAGLGQYAMDIYDYISGKVAPREVERPTKTTTQKPLARAFLVNEAATGKPMEFVYDELSKLETKRKGLQQQDQDLTGIEKDRYEILSKYKDAIYEVSKQMRDVQNSKDFNSEEKRDILLDLSKTRNSFAKEAYDMYKRGKPAGEFFTKYNLTDSQNERLALGLEQGLTEQQIIDAFTAMQGLTKNVEKYDAINSLPYDLATKDKLFMTLVKEQK